MTTPAKAADAPTARPEFSKYRDDPVGFAKHVLGITLWDRIAEAMRALLEPPYKVSIDAAHALGKSHGMAVCVNWWYWTRDPSWVITTAPTDRDVRDILWTEVRLQQQAAKGRTGVEFPPDLMPAAAEMSSSPDHVAKGFTARDANSAVGRHRKNMLFLFDEKEGVAAAFWDGMKSMFRPGSGDAVMVVGNPHTTTTRAYFEHIKTNPGDGSPVWRRVRLSALDHPNVVEGREVIPGAVTRGQVEKEWIPSWTDPVVPGDQRPPDFQWPPGDPNGKWHRPNIIGEPRILGLRPSASVDGVWSEALFQHCLGPVVYPPPDVIPVIGCDVAGRGDDFTSIHSRMGGVSLTHEAGSGWAVAKIARRLMETADALADMWNARRPSDEWRPIGGIHVPINIEDDAIGRAVQELLSERGYRFHAINASHQARRPDMYPNRRSELWFAARDRAAAGGVQLAKLPRDVQERLQQQLLAPKWGPDSKGRRVVEPKEETKKKLGRSPDDADGMNAAFVEPGDGGIAVVHRPAADGPPVGGRGQPEPRQDWTKARGLYGVKPG